MTKKTVIITGATRGIGRAAAELFAERGYTVCACGRTGAADLAAKYGADRMDVYSFDVSDYAAARAAVREMVSKHGAIDALVNNAGIAHYALLQDTAPEDWRRVIDTDLGGAYNMTHSLLPYMLAEKRGAIVNVSSEWGVYGGSNEVAYSAAKAGVIGFTRALAKETGRSGIRVNAVAPGAIETDMLADFTAEELRAVADSSTLGRLGKPTEVAEAIYFLTEDTSSYVNGAVLEVTG